MRQEMSRYPAIFPTDTLPVAPASLDNDERYTGSMMERSGVSVI